MPKTIGVFLIAAPLASAVVSVCLKFSLGDALAYFGICMIPGCFAMGALLFKTTP